jgi:hypothetical protein
MPRFSEVLDIPEKWVKLIYKSNPEYLELLRRNNGFIIYLDSNKLSKEQKSCFVPALKLFEAMGAIGYKNYAYKNIFYNITKSFEKFLGGELLIRSKECFIKFYNKFEEFYCFIEKYGAKNFPEQYNNFNMPITNTIKPQRNLRLDDITEEITHSNLSSCSDGTIRYKGTIIKLRAQIKDLCRLFLQNYNHLVTQNDIKDKIIKSNKRDKIDYNTISKYISELRTSLKVYTRKNVIYLEKEEG